MPVSIRKILQKRLFIAALFVFLATALAFGLGYLTALDSNRAPIVIEKVSPKTTNPQE